MKLKTEIFGCASEKKKLLSTLLVNLLIFIIQSKLLISCYYYFFVIGPNSLRLPAYNFPQQQLAFRPMKPRLKKRPSWRFFCSTQENQAPREKLILCRSTPPWTPQFVFFLFCCIFILLSR